MSKVHKSTAKGKTPADGQIDLREQPYNDREVGPIERVQLPLVNITRLHGVILDIDRHLFRRGERTAGAQKGPKTFFRETVSGWLRNDVVLADAEARSTGRGLHVLLWLAEPVVFETEGDRQRWAGIVQIIQCVLPIDPDQPGITALTRPVGSINGKTGKKVTGLQQGKPIPIAAILDLHERMVHTPFRTIMGVLLGAEHVAPCPICGGEGSSLTALDRVGQCYGSCGKVRLAALYDLFLLPRPKAKGASES